jgi:hypothetical protein
MIALPMIGVFILISMFNETLPHWSGPAYVTLLPLVGTIHRIANSKNTSVYDIIEDFCGTYFFYDHWWLYNHQLLSRGLESQK